MRLPQMDTRKSLNPKQHQRLFLPLTTEATVVADAILRTLWTNLLF